jgi:prepilin signal peptidase PulO-like enzyme (type II secretory pathway)
MVFVPEWFAFWAYAGLHAGGSAACMAYRIPRKINPWIHSRCDSCGGPVRWWLLVPGLSWPLLRGRCGRCGVRIPVRYWLAELAGVPPALVPALAGPAWWAIAVALAGWLAEFVFLLALEKRIAAAERV